MRDETLLRDQIVFAVQCGLFEDIGRRIAEGFMASLADPENMKRLVLVFVKTLEKPQ